MTSLEVLFSSMGVSLDVKRETPLHDGWICYSLNHLNPSKKVPIILIERGPKNIAEVKKHVKKLSTCIIFFEEKNILFFKSSGESHTATLENDSDYRRIASILNSTGIANAQDEIDLQIAIKQLVDKIPNTTGDFENKGLFSTHYLRSRVFDDARQDVGARLVATKEAIGDTDKTLQALGWDVSNSSGSYYDGAVSITVTEQEDFGIRKSDVDVAPSYTAIATLRQSKWSILTNGRRWRLYSARVSSSSTNYFEIVLDPENDAITRYLVVLFGAESFLKKDEKTDIDMFFDEGKNYGKSLEENLATRIMSHDGLFLDIVKGVLDHDMKKTFSSAELESAKQTSLKIMYRVWFLAYAESRNLLPVRDERYRPVSLQSIRNQLDKFEDKPNGHECWDKLADLFRGIRNGSKQHNLPQYNGDLFKNDPAVDGMSIRNEFMTKALYGLLEDDGSAIDYTDFSVRHLGNIFETLMEYSPRQADKDIMLLEDSKGVREVTTQKDATYSYKKNDLYLASKGGIVSRKMSASFYTPDEIVKFLVDRGLRPILAEREKLIGDDIRRYRKSKSEKDLQICMDRMLDIQVLDPSMGSGHFLVEALNRITLWATGVLKQHTDHPLLSEIESDRKIVLDEQMEKGITIDESLLTADVLLKRKIMKRCIFGVDLNPMAVDLAKLSLWLDSFAIGVPLTYMDHHLKTGDSTIGMWMSDRSKKTTDQMLDAWMGRAQTVGNALHYVSRPTDITIGELKTTMRRHMRYELEIKPYKKMLDVLAATHMDPDVAKNSPKDLTVIFDIARGQRSNDERHDMVVNRTSVLSSKYRFFHWELEMMDAFADARKGFDLILGNPPWDKIRPNKNEFFSQFMSGYKKASAIKKRELHDKYDREYNVYKKEFDEKRAFYKGRGGLGENTDYDAYRLVVERMLELLAEGGVMSIVAPQAIIISRGATAIRQHMLEHKIVSLYEFENRNRIFPIHRQTKFVLLTVQNTESDDDFPVAFYLQDERDLDDVGSRSFNLSKKNVKSLSPNMLLICDFRSQNYMKIALDLFSSHQRLEEVEGWAVTLGRELNMGEQKDKRLLTDSRTGSWPVMESKNFHQHIWNFSRPSYRARTRETLRRTARIGNFGALNEEIHRNPRFVYRSISSSTNTRTMISSIIPPSVFTAIGAYMAIPLVGELSIDQNYHRLNAYLCGIFNSMTFDYLIRPKVDKNVETYHIYDTIVPSDFKGETAGLIGRLSALLFLSDTWHDGFADVFAIQSVEVADFNIQRRLDTVAEIDALVALHYGLEYNEYKTILDNFTFNDSGLTAEELESRPVFSDMEKRGRDRFMSRFFGDVRKAAIQHYENHVNPGGECGA